MRVSKTSPDDPTACRSHTVRDINVRQQQDSAWKSEVGMMSAKKVFQTP